MAMPRLIRLIDINVTDNGVLDLSSKGLFTLPCGLSKLTEVKQLILKHNPLITLLPEIGLLTNVTHLDLSQCQLHTLPPEFWKLTQLEWLDLCSNPLQTLPAEVGQLTNIKHLELATCELQTLPLEIGNLTQLECLKLSFNPLQTLPAEVGQLTNIKRLDIGRCYFETFPSVVCKLTKLEWLNLNSNDTPLRTLPGEFGQLNNLKHLDLFSCKLETIPPEVGLLTQLERMDLSLNPLETLPAEIGQLTNLKHLAISCCGLTTLPAEFEKLTQLEYLELEGNPLKTLPAEVGKLTKMKHLAMSHCPISTFPSEVGRLTQLEWLVLKCYPLKTLPVEVWQIVNVTHLDLSNGEITTLPPDVGTLSRLEWLNLAFNHLQTLPATVGQLTNMKHLDLSYCRLAEIPAEVMTLRQLKFLSLKSNNLFELPEDMSQLQSLEKFEVDYNKLSYLPDSICSLQNLRSLSACRNNIKTLPVRFGQLKRLTKLNIKDNPLQLPPIEVCEQGIEAIRQYFDELERSGKEVSARLKIVVLGKTLAGKTSLVLTLSSGKSSLTEEADRTHCVEITQWAPGDNITFEVYDFGGHDVYHLTHQFFLTQDTLHLLTVNLSTYNCTEQCYTEAVGFWLDTLISRVPEAVVTLVFSHVDGCNSTERQEKTRHVQQNFELQQRNRKRSVTQHTKRLKNVLDNMDFRSEMEQEEIKERYERTRRLLKRQLRLTGVCCVSSAEPTCGMDALKEHILESANNPALFPTLRKILPRTWVDLEQRLFNLRDKGAEEGNPGETMRSANEPQTQQHQPAGRPKWLHLFECSKEGELAGLRWDGLEPVLYYLQQVGTILRYTDIPELKDLVFHDPHTLIEIFKDLFHHDIDALFSTENDNLDDFTSSQLTTFKLDLLDRGMMRKDVLTSLLPSNTDPTIVTALMQNFGLCFETQVPEALEGTDISKDACLYRIPWYLQKQMPEELISVWPAEVPEKQEQLQLMCNISGFCPRGLFQRFSVGIHPYVTDRIDWKDGVLAFKKDHRILICSKPVANETYITIATRGRLAQAEELWGVVHPLLEVLVQLLQEWPGVLYSLHVTCAHCIKAGLDNPHQYDLSNRRAPEDGREVRCPRVKFTATVPADLVSRPVNAPRGTEAAEKQEKGTHSHEVDTVSTRPGSEVHGQSTDVDRYFYYIKENVTAEWKDLAYWLEFSRPDVDNIDERNRDYKSRCMDMLGEWQKREGDAATIHVLMEALRELKLTSVLDGLKSTYPELAGDTTSYSGAE